MIDRSVIRFRFPTATSTFSSSATIVIQRHEMRLASDHRCELLLAVQSTFIKALPEVNKGVNTSLALARENLIKMVRTDVKLMAINLNEEWAWGCELSEKSFHDGCFELASVLSFFEDLIHDRILTASQNRLQHAVSSSNPFNDPLLASISSHIA